MAGKTTGRGAQRRARGRGVVVEVIERFENELMPADLRAFSRRVRRGLGRVERQLETARREQQVFWRRRTNRARRDAVKLLQRLERVIEPRASKRPAAAKAARKRTPRKKAAA
jgi:hypothetical protein